MTHSDFIPFARPDVGAAEAQAVAEAIRSGWLTSGPVMRAFEQDFTDYLGGDVQSVAVNSATAGLHLALEAIGIQPGDEVIVPTWTFTATAEVVRYLGATPVIVDIEPDTINISPAAVASAITDRTRAVIPVHFAGLAADIPGIRAAINGRNIAIIEDAAHALPTVGPDGLVGSCTGSDAAVFSFYATKTMTTGEGGMLTTRNPEIAGRARIMRLHGIDRDAFDRYTSTKPAWAYDVIAPGFKYNMPDTAAALGRVQLARAEEMRKRRQSIAEFYLHALRDATLVLPAKGTENDVHAWHLFVIRLENDAHPDRETFIGRMNEAGVGTSVHFIPLHRHSYWAPFAPDAQGRLTVSESLADSAVSLPISSAMTDDMVERAAQAVLESL
jgi:dTDP-4-amino-4,6-dideoxygalactose transaminase